MLESLVILGCVSAWLFLCVLSLLAFPVFAHFEFDASKVGNRVPFFFFFVKQLNTQQRVLCHNRPTVKAQCYGIM